ncbi:MAG TPA: hypothetical protein VL752_07365 [Acidisoma sp.]|jgi:outer membrane protein OmpA-like peptidoglycan-associated protein|uniref:hypothetical protein n=1 Tax=Acidisoma sp. TaxID=1872115 RepID=UPI002BF8CB25|nr:hypothetical protein [Acidisoma sp.]HTI00748.1 hypothetical protein [Acidisoma sp.]
MRWLFGIPLLLSVAACALVTPQPTGKRFPVFFAPMTASVDNGASGVVTAAANFAKSHPSDAITLVAYGAPPGNHYVEPADIDGERASAVTAQLVADGVDKNRIGAIAKGPVQPDVPMSKIEVRRVDIIVGDVPPVK